MRLCELNIVGLVGFDGLCSASLLCDDQTEAIGRLDDR